LRKPVAQKRFVFDDEIFLPEVFLARVGRAVQECGLPVADPLPPCEVELLENRLVRADVSYPKKRLLGSIGSVRLRFAGGVGAWAEPLLPGGALGAGKARLMGQGRYEIAGHPLPAGWPPAPAHTLLERAAGGEQLAGCRTALAQAGPTPGVDGVDKEEFLDSLTRRMPEIASCLRTGKVQPSPLRGLLVHSRDAERGTEKLRPLAIPTLRDRFMQRAVLEELAPAVEMLLEDSSFAYRKGLSHRSAHRGVLRARDQGYVHALDADIRAFFDEVDWDLLRLRLEALLGPDPVVEAIMQWVRAPVELEERTVPRQRGLPQGMVLSPLLANLLLDAFDETVLLRGFKLVRFADDFVVLGKKPEQLVEARKVVSEELRRLGLALK